MIVSRTMYQGLEMHTSQVPHFPTIHSLFPILVPIPGALLASSALVVVTWLSWFL
jgi:hypothetical protein